MQSIRTSNGRFAIVDDCDADLADVRWYCSEINGYAKRDVGGRKNRARLRMHRVIAKRMGLEGEIDHINGDKLDNRRCNLRQVTRSSNNYNRKKTNGVSRFKGVALTKYGKWRAYITINNRQRHLGVFEDEENAARAYDNALRELGEEHGFNLS